MSELPCHYHADRIAHDKCEKCKKLLCLECKVNYSDHHSSGDPDGSRYTTHHILCPECNILNQKNNTFTTIFTCIISILFILGIQVGVMSNAKEEIAPSIIWGLAIFILCVGVLIISLIAIDNRKKIKELEKVANELKNLRKTQKNLTQIVSSKEEIQIPDIKNNYCSDCGKPNQKNSPICEHCGFIMK